MKIATQCFGSFERKRQSFDSFAVASLVLQLREAKVISTLLKMEKLEKRAGVESFHSKGLTPTERENGHRHDENTQTEVLNRTELNGKLKASIMQTGKQGWCKTRKKKSKGLSSRLLIKREDPVGEL